MPILEDLSNSVDTQSPDNPNAPLGTLAAGAAMLSKALQSIPELAEAAQMIAAMGGSEDGAVAPGGGMADKGGKYNGTVDFMGRSVEIKNGIGDVEGYKMYVTPDGAAVTNDKGLILGRVENGKFVAIDKNYAAKLEQNKMAERGPA